MVEGTDYSRSRMSQRGKGEVTTTDASVTIERQGYETKKQGQGGCQKSWRQGAVDMLSWLDDREPKGVLTGKNTHIHTNRKFAHLNTPRFTSPYFFE